MSFTLEEIAGGVDKDATRQKSFKAAVIATLLTGTAIYAALVFKRKLKAPTLH